MGVKCGQAVALTRDRSSDLMGEVVGVVGCSAADVEDGIPAWAREGSIMVWRDFRWERRWVLLSSSITSAMVMNNRQVLLYARTLAPRVRHGGLNVIGVGAEGAACTHGRCGSMDFVRRYRYHF